MPGVTPRESTVATAAPGSVTHWLTVGMLAAVFCAAVVWLLTWNG
jgi:hypothetical protein